MLTSSAMVGSVLRAPAIDYGGFCAFGNVAKDERHLLEKPRPLTISGNRDGISVDTVTWLPAFRPVGPIMQFFPRYCLEAFLVRCVWQPREKVHPKRNPTPRSPFAPTASITTRTVEPIATIPTANRRAVDCKAAPALDRTVASTVSAVGGIPL